MSRMPEDQGGARTIDAPWHRHGLELVETLPGRVGGSLLVVHVRNGRHHYVLKQVNPVAGAREISVLKELSGHGVTDRKSVV